MYYTCMELTFKKLQQEHRRWAEHNFPHSQPYHPLLGALEELGELAHAHLKSEQGIRGTRQELREKKIDAVADVIIFLADYCSKNNIDMQQAVESTWNEVKKRDWQKNNRTG